jgi:glycosyltransferase involved in cell wall biosynthesis
MKNPKISIITICYNSETHIEEAIQSVINQSYENKEYIIIDGGSTDGTLSIVEKYRDKIDYFISEPDKGISDAFNKGIKAATGDVIGIINSDDKLEEDALQIVANHYEDNVDLYRGVLRMWNSETGFVYDQYPTMNWPKIPVKMAVSHPSTFVTKRAYNQYGVYNVGLKYSMDLDLLLRFERNQVVKKYIDYPLAFFRLGGVSQSNESKRQKEICMILANNGSSKFHIFCFRIYYVFRLTMKHLINNLFGKEIKSHFSKRI